MKLLLASLAITVVATSFSLQQDNGLPESIKRGEQIYVANCVSCHMMGGEGIAGAFPPLAKSDYLLADPERAIHHIIHGASGEITVNGVQYNGVMPPQSHLSDEEVADVMNYIMNSWGNKGKQITAGQVKAKRS
ncbi:cytochrome c [Cesiribacter sp. SM1]|uniref:c-type cytochrome n=1 Tax=Cesiribacter sp. SM1 TaxID=2861196 RepID=UPI001CD22890|nr:cytochrome c [Cesiribacter sp. SM1]